MSDYKLFLNFLSFFKLFAFISFVHGNVNDNFALNNQFKYHVAVNVVWSDDRSLTCGGSILKSKWVLTAAKCLTIPEKLAMLGKVIKSVYITAGDISLKQNNDSNKRQEVKASKFIVPKNYDRECVNWDVGLILLLKELEFNDFVKSIKIPELENNIQLDFSCETVGWSVTENKNRSQLLKWGEVKVLKNKKCMEYFDDFEVTSLKICVSIWHGSKHGCHGDLGGSLACTYTKNGTKEHYLYGVENFGIPAKDCRVLETTTVYTKISKYSTWINCVIAASTSINSSIASSTCDEEILNLAKTSGQDYECYKSGSVTGHVYLIIALTLLISCVVFYLYKRKRALKQEKILKQRLVLKNLEKKLSTPKNSKENPVGNISEKISSKKDVAVTQALEPEIIKANNDSISDEIINSL